MADVFEQLRRGYAISIGDRLLPGAGGYSLGAITPVIASQATAREWLSEMAEDVDSLGRAPAEIVPVGNPWKFMRRAAGEGIAGIQVIADDAELARFMFMVRVEEAGAELPTVLASMTDEGWGPCLARAGVKRFAHAELLHWQRFDILDPVNGQWGQNCPFRGWEHGDPLYEVRSDGVVILLADVPLLDHWNSPDGAFAFFTSEEAAFDYLEHHLNDGRNRVLFYAPDSGTDPRSALSALRPEPVPDLGVRLAELEEINPFATWCVNPIGHREDSGYGRFIDWSEPGDEELLSPDDLAAPHADGLDAEEASEDDSATPETAHRMSAVSGTWKIKPENIFELEQPITAWRGHDTIRWSGGQSLQLLPLDRSFVLDQTVSDLELDEEMSESELDEVIASYLGSKGLEDSWQELGDRVERDAGCNLEGFYVVAWDAVTGEGADYPWQFPGFLPALRHLAAFEREHDREHRASGAASHSHIGFAGSGDTEAEELRSARFQLGLRRLGIRAVRQGYRPSDAGDLVALCNGALRTLHVDYAGFAKDLLWASGSEQQDDLLEALEIEESEWLQWATATDVPYDPAGRKLAVKRMGEETWNRLAPKVRHFLATALLRLEEQGHAPQLDYAPISLEIVKALEAELGELMEGFRRSVEGQVLQYDEEDRTDQELAKFVAGGKAPTLGSIPYLFKTTKSGASDLRVALHNYLAALPNSAFLTSSKFLNHGLGRVTNKYRNGGVHDSPISEATCRECVEDLVGTLDAPGYISLVVSWKQ